MNSEHLIATLIQQTNEIIQQVEKLKEKETSFLTWKQNPTSWSVLECLEHLNLYGDFYLLEIESKVISSKSKFETEFKSGILGNYFAKSMLPQDKMKKMNTFKDKKPLNANLDKSVIDKFISQQLLFIDLLNQARNVSLNKTTITTSISKLIKLKLGDTFQFLINHILRHLKQIERVEKAQFN